MVVDSTQIEFVAKIVAPILTGILIAVFKHFAEGRARLVSYIGHTSAFNIQANPPMAIHTHSVVVANSGQKTAFNVRMGHNIWPQSVNVIPASVAYKVEQNPAGLTEIVFPQIVRKEQITISYLYFPPLVWTQINSYTKSDDGYAKIINAIPIAQPPKWLMAILWVLIFGGLGLVLYWGVKLAALLLFDAA
ncbi:hypothetical protein [Herbaspirillum chlorophenolicum]|uniref:hypothetical protein n=1 Tax=Herbaspirillum chlorophenolicum TaxID=211589 RepID=UPI00067E4EF8|nr:hypothetical protein [Herbaspirillum chlorophenolicum]